MKKLKVILDGNSYAVVEEEGEDIDWIVAYDRAVWGEQAARQMARTYIDGYNDGYREATPISSGLASDS